VIELDRLRFDDRGLVTVVAQDFLTGVVLMVAHASRESLELTIATREMHYHSRRRGLWRKGATSGNVQTVVSLTPDCDGDAVLARVRPAGPACHEGTISCFRAEALAADAIAEVDRIVNERAESGSEVASYTRTLLLDRNRRLKKIGEETAELVTACADGDKQAAAAEAADLFYHVIVALRGIGVRLDDVRSVLASRRR
jgi:phosphoribosyl-AMP cyclohydrolase / phosphoribosyl-ATP pyrophosphohydrolase